VKSQEELADSITALLRDTMGLRRYGYVIGYLSSSADISGKF
jgi:hypothetical protein